MHLQAENPMIFNVKLFDIMFYSLKDIKLLIFYHKNWDLGLGQIDIALINGLNWSCMIT